MQIFIHPHQENKVSSIQYTMTITITKKYSFRVWFYVHVSDEQNVRSRVHAIALFYSVFNRKGISQVTIHWSIDANFAPIICIL